MKKILNKWVPKYAIFPLLLVLFTNFVTYYCSKLITNPLYHYNISSSLDFHIPFFPPFSIIYILAYFQWGMGYLIICRENEKSCYFYLTAEIIAKLFCLFFFLIFPTTLERPFFSPDSFSLLLTTLIYKTDTPVNLFPSIHCLESWMCFRAALSLKKVSPSYKYFMFLFTILVFLSTILIKQHVLIDIVGGILVVEAGIFLTKKYHIDKKLEYFCKEKIKFFQSKKK